MDQRLSVITLGVANLERARRFYEDVLGWTPFGDAPEIVFFDLGGFALGLYPHDKLAEDMKLPHCAPEPGERPRFALAYNTRQPEDVDRLLTHIASKGGKILKPAEQVFWGGYSGYFADPDGHPWEVAHNPHWPLDDNGRVQVAG